MKKTIIIVILIIGLLFAFAYFQDPTSKTEVGVLSNLTSSLTEPITTLSKDGEKVNLTEDTESESKTQNINEKEVEKESRETKKNNDSQVGNKSKDLINDNSTLFSSEEIKNIFNQNLASLSKSAENSYLKAKKEAEDSYSKIKEESTKKISDQEEKIKDYIINNSESLSKEMRKEICKQLCETCD